jgi:hypothetical protein
MENDFAIFTPLNKKTLRKLRIDKYINGVNFVIFILSRPGGIVSRRFITAHNKVFTLRFACPSGNPDTSTSLSTSRDFVNTSRYLAYYKKINETLIL